MVDKPRSRKREMLIATDTAFGEPGDIELGDTAEIVVSKERGIISEIDGDGATLILSKGGEASLPKACFRAVRERSRGHDTRARARK